MRQYSLLLSVVIISTGFCSTAVGPASAQGLFGGESVGDNASTRLDVNASMVEGYDSDVPQELRPALDPSGLESGGLYSTLDLAASYSWRNAHTQVGANATSIVRYYSSFGETRSLGQSGGFGVSTRLPGKFTFLANQAAAYSPSYLSSLFPTGGFVEVGDSGHTAQDYRANDFEVYTYTTTVSLGRSLGRRTSVGVVMDYQYNDRVHETDLWGDLNAHSLSGRLSRNLSRNAVLTTQYRYRSGEFGFALEGKTRQHAIDVGINYTRPLSPTRRVVMGFSVGAAKADVPQLFQNAVIRHEQYLGTSEAELDYQFGRSWRAGARFRRGLEYVVDIPDPVFANGLRATVGGFASRRVDLSFSAAYSSGESLLSRTALTFDTYTGDIRVRYGLTRQAAAYIEYLYYYYSFRGVRQLLAGIPSGLERNGVHVGVTVWMPAIRR